MADPLQLGVRALELAQLWMTLILASSYYTASFVFHFSEHFKERDFLFVFRPTTLNEGSGYFFSLQVCTLGQFKLLTVAIYFEMISVVSIFVTISHAGYPPLPPLPLTDGTRPSNPGQFDGPAHQWPLSISCLRVNCRPTCF